MSCRSFSNTSPSCRTVTLIEPDNTLLSATSSGSTDLSLDESGSVILEIGQVVVPIQFTVAKASTEWRFEYLYVDAFGVPNPGTIFTVPETRTVYGCTVNLAGAPTLDGYILRWRAVVVSLTTGLNIDAPESLRVQLTPGARSQTFLFVNARSSTDYPFDELRVENLIQPADSQRFIVPQVVAKDLASFTVGFSTPANTADYFLVARVP